MSLWRPATLADLEALRPKPAKVPAPKSRLPESRPAVADLDTPNSSPAPVACSPRLESEIPAPAQPPAPISQQEPLQFADPAAMYMFFHPEMVLDKWQIQELTRLGGRLDPKSPEISKPTKLSPFIYNLAAANGSGKDAVMIAGFAAWFAACKKNSKCVITSSSHDQLKTQTFAHISSYCQLINDELGRKVFDIIEFFVTNTDTGSTIELFRSDDPAKVEGRHAKFGGEFAFIVNEAKSVADPLHNAFDRFTGWNYWMQFSSTGDVSGRFYLTSVGADDVYPAPARLGKQYLRKITAFECSHISPARIERIEKIHGKESPIYKSSILSEFTSHDDLVLISPAIVNYFTPAWRTFDLPLKAGLDIGLGGDECVLDIWHGNKRIAQEILMVADGGMLHHKLIALFNKHGLKAENIIADFGGIGKPIVQRLWENGWAIRTINNEGAPFNKKDFLNRGAETWHKIKRLIEQGVLILPLVQNGYPENDQKLINELTTRRYSIENGKVKLEKKKDMKARGLSSPNRADALALVFADVPIETFLDIPVEVVVETPFSEVIQIPIPAIAELQRLNDSRRYGPPRGDESDDNTKYVQTAWTKMSSLLQL